MGAIWQICKRELKYFFVSPRGYMVMALFLFLQGWIFFLIVNAFSSQAAPVGSIMQVFMGKNIFFWIFLLLVLPVVTMGLLAEERRTGTIELLLTAPVTEGQVVTGKFLGAFFYYLTLWVPTLLYPFIISRFSPVDPWPIASSYLYLLLIGAPFVALGVLTSALSRNQITAAILTSSLIFLLFLLPIFLEGLVTSEGARKLLSYINIWNTAGDYGKGIVDSRFLVYSISSTVLLLLGATRTLELRKAR